jgi:hypothetical protein
MPDFVEIKRFRFTQAQREARGVLHWQQVQQRHWIRGYDRRYDMQNSTDEIREIVRREVISAQNTDADGKQF